MPDCECLATSPFFNDRMGDRPATAEIYKKKYCREDNACCARHMIFKRLGRDKVPPDLFPSQIDRARIIMNAGP